MMWQILIVAGLWLPTVAVAGDACDSIVPPDLKAQLLSKYPTYRLPVESDNLAEDIETTTKAGQSACLGVAKADFDGNGREDWAVGLTARHGDGWAVVVALTQPQGWDLQVLGRGDSLRNRLYVAAGESGKYDRALSLEGPLEPGEVDQFDCPQSVVVFGETESSGTAYCLLNGKWEHVWFSD